MMVALGTVSVCAADFTRYHVILDRLPFGSEAVPAAAGAAAVDAQPAAPAITKTLKMCAITRHDRTGALQVGLVDTATKKNYFITVGETEDGITVVEADYDNEKALLSKDGQETWITMSDVATMAATPTPPPTLVRPRLPMPVLGGGVTMPANREAMAEARRTRRGMSTNTLSGEALQAHLEKYQMDLIRAGGEKGPPLPIPLTPEMDQQLVKEGVLPAQ
jgi:hypothetical protein